jgi:hypothetical protein
MGGGPLIKYKGFLRFGCEGGANPPRGHEEMREWASEGV